ncbi:hypothetical protein [Thalassotalea sp. SU-HH00458]|uniref:thrombospondin type 3 repeat-containing protein n=1 Tax=Thalassotalea sp. SU-HH00458 TaxID=3127657 RepID=UPI0031055234
MKFGWINVFIINVIVLCSTMTNADEQKRFLVESDVLFTQPLWHELNSQHHGKYSKYQVDTTMWGFLPPTFPNFDAQNDFESSMQNYIDGLASHKEAGVAWVSRIEWDVIWRGMTTKYPQNYQSAMVKRLDGSPLEIKWFPGHYYFSTHAPLFQDYIKWQIKDIAFYGETTGPDTVGALLFDSQHTSPAQYHLGGGFSENTQSNFRDWLIKKYSKSDLKSIGVDDVAEFHYGRYLQSLGYTVETYEAATLSGAKIPLAEFFKLFLKEWNNTYLSDLVNFTDAVAKDKGYPKKSNGDYIEVGTSSPILDPYFKGIRFASIDEFDFYVQEFNHKGQLETVSSEVMLMYKLAEAIGKPLALTGQPNTDWNYMVDNPEAIDLVKAWIAQAYSNGAVFMAPEQMWSYNNQGQRYYNAQTGDYDYIYQWIAENNYLFDDFESVAKVGLVYSHAAYRQSQYNQLDIFSAATELMEQNIPFKLLVAGDDWWPKYLMDTDQISQIDNYQVLIQTPFNGYALDTTQQQILDYNKDKLVSWPNLAQLQQLVPTEITVNADKVATFPRVNHDFPHNNPPHIIHLVNRDFNKNTKSINTKDNIVITVADTLFGKSMLSARFNQPGQEVIKLSVEYKNGVATINVPKLVNWGVIELFASETMPDKSEFAPKIKVVITDKFDQNELPDNEGFVYLDSQGDDNEKIHRFGEGWAWGAFSSGGIISQNNNWGGIVQFQQGAKKNSRLYTRFDKNTELTAENNANVPNELLDISSLDANLIFNVSQSPAQQWAMIIRDDTTWWRSSALNVPKNDWDSTRTTSFNISQLTWLSSEQSSEGIQDMEQVDNGGEGEVNFAVEGVPNLTQISGFGVIALEDGSETMSINELGLANVYSYKPSSLPSEDSDNDGCLNIDDAFPNDPQECLDTDNDGIGNNADNDDDNDGVLDDEDAFPLDSSESIDTDNDGIGNNADSDDDNDGYSDSTEVSAGSDPLSSSSIPQQKNNENDASTSSGGSFSFWLLILLALVLKIRRMNSMSDLLVN